MRADLHIHTYYSDGKYSPHEIARRAAESGLDLISMTDHDSLDFPKSAPPRGKRGFRS